MIIECPACQTGYHIDPAATSKKTVRVRCPGCGHLFLFEMPGPAPACTILVVDDARFFREMILDVLQPLAATFFTAGDGLEALQILRRERPSLTLLDLNLPGMSGYELIREVRADPALRHLRLLAMSAVFRKEEDASAVLAAGADDFLSKSFKPQQLLLRVQKLLNK